MTAKDDSLKALPSPTAQDRTVKLRPVSVSFFHSKAKCTPCLLVKWRIIGTDNCVFSTFSDVPQAEWKTKQAIHALWRDPGRVRVPVRTKPTISWAMEAVFQHAVEKQRTCYAVLKWAAYGSETNQRCGWEVRRFYGEV